MIKRINEVFPDWLDKGIFTTLNSFDVPWKDSITPKELDIAYHGGHSGNKIVSPLVDSLLSNEELTDNSKMLIATSIMALYGKNWTKLWDTLSFEYNPIENYSMIETEEITGQSTSNVTTEENETIEGLNTSTGNGKTTDTGTVDKVSEGETKSDNDTSNSVYGFNSSNPVETDSQNGTINGTTNNSDTETRNLVANTESSNNETIENTRNADTITTNTGTSTNSKTLTRSGNIGVTTSQQMIESERELWNWYFFDLVFRDIDKMLTLSIY